MITVNANGIEQIAAALGEFHRLGRDHFTADMLRAWAVDVETSHANGNGAEFEIRSFDSLSGAAVEVRIDAAGYDFVGTIADNYIGGNLNCTPEDQFYQDEVTFEVTNDDGEFTFFEFADGSGCKINSDGEILAL
jgi:hypothetical protein